MLISHGVPLRFNITVYLSNYSAIDLYQASLYQFFRLTSGRYSGMS